MKICRLPGITQPHGCGTVLVKDNCTNWYSMHILPSVFHSTTLFVAQWAYACTVCMRNLPGIVTVTGGEVASKVVTPSLVVTVTV